jgi:predicted branched-subunit amino acid permease
LFYLPRIRQHPAFKAGLMTGVAMTQSGLSSVESVAMNFIVFAGSAQLASLPLIAAAAPMWVILATAFCVNLRFVVFSAHLKSYVSHLPRRHRLPLGFLVGDLTYVMFTRQHAEPALDPVEREAQMAFLTGHATCNCSAWMASSLIGVFLASFIPPAWGIGFAGVLALLGILFSLVTDRLRLLATAVAAVAAVLAFTLPLRLNVLVAIAAAVVVGLLIERSWSAAASVKRP